MTDKEQLEWLWANCRVIHFPKNTPMDYPIEHNMAARKDCRRMIEAIMV